MNAHEVMLNKGVAYRKTVQALEKHLAPHHLSVAEWLCLGAVASGKHGGGKISDILGVTKGMASRQLGVLVERGLVSELTDKQDARHRTYSLTQKGKKVLEAADASATAGLKDWLGSVDSGNIRIYIEVLQVVARL